MVARRRLVAERAPMELRQWVRRVLGGGGAREQRDAWDAVWAAVLDAVLRDDELPDATPRDIEQELLQFFKDHDICWTGYGSSDYTCQMRTKEAELRMKRRPLEQQEEQNGDDHYRADCF